MKRWWDQECLPAPPCPPPSISLTQLIRLDDVTQPPLPGSDADRIAGVVGGMISIGNFDGVHLGHAALLGQLKRLAADAGVPAVAVTFDPHPAALLRPESVPPPLTDMATRAERMSSLGLDALVVCRTSTSMLRLEAEDFYWHLVRGRLAARGMVEGPNFYFGRDRGGDVQDLRHWCQRDGLSFQIADATDDLDGMISSSRVRELITLGQVEAAGALMGRPHRIIGTVAHGAARGRTMGFPTANLESIGVVIPPPGVYGGRVDLEGGSRLAAIHIGPNPTFSDSPQMKVEVHVLDYDGDLYERKLAVDVGIRVRDIARFDSADALIGQLQQDIQMIRRKAG